MNTLTAYRSFGKPSYRPKSARVRILDSKWYLVTMQDTETDQGDGHYLLDTESTYLLPGKEARARRDAHLNHCNRVAEYTGEVWEIANGKHPFAYPEDRYHPSRAAALAHFAKLWQAEERQLRAEFDLVERRLAKPDAALADRRWDMQEAAALRTMLSAVPVPVVRRIRP